MAGRSTVPAMITDRPFAPSSAAPSTSAVPPPASGPVIAEIGVLLAAHLGVALAVCLLLDLWTR